ncbi:MAG TPA: hypothetical protein VFI49_09670 [Rudaea sp.]|nr:hypothetical protein [Rudaea sp.]
MITAVAWTLIRGHGAENPSHQAGVATTTGASAIPEEQRAGRNAAKPTRKFKGALTDATLPPPGTPLAQTYNELKARADAGDAAAASRLFRDTYRCVLAREQLLNMPAAVGFLLEGDTSKLSAEQLDERERRLASMETHMSAARKESKNCEGLDETQLLVTPVMLEAARLGDLAAGNCYVEGYLLSDPRLFDHPDWVSDYKSNALAIAKANVASGDWGAVAQLQHAYARDGYAALLLGRILAPDSVQNYRYLKLRRLGANAENAPYYDRDLSFVARGLSADQVAAGDAWAQETYLHYFDAAPENTVGAFNSPTCPDPND